MKQNSNGMVLFREARKGYCREDVNRYIEEMNLQFSMTESELKGTIRQLEEKLAQRSALFFEQDDSDALRLELDTVKQQNEQLIAENKRLTDENKKLNEKPSSAKPETAQEILPTLSYDEASRKLGDILLKANLDADRIVSDAEAEAGRQLAGAEKRADDIRLDAAVTAKLMSDRVKERLAALTAAYLEKFSTLSADSFDEYRKACDDLNEKLSTARLRAEYELKKTEAQND